MRDGLTRLGNYRLIRQLGRGGFAEVYLGEHIHLKTQAAIKVLQTQLSENDQESFTREAQIIANLIHPHIVRVLEFGIEHTIPFLVMDYAPGGTLRQSYPMGQFLQLPTVVSYVKQVASALQYAHGRKIIHRDIKPENILLRRSNELLLSDFGIALVTQSSRYQSPAPDAAGTISYMAPEQLQGHPSAASDQYALGVVVYEWLCGERPFKGSYTEVGSQHMFAPPPSIRVKVPAVPPEVEDVVFTALAKEPQRRFANVQAFAQALEQASRGSATGQNATTYPVTFPLMPQTNSHPSSSVAPTVLSGSPTNTVASSNTGKQTDPRFAWPQPAFSAYPPMPSTSGKGVPPPPYAMNYPPAASYPPVQVVMPPPPRPKKNGCCIATAVVLILLVLGGMLLSGEAFWTQLVALNGRSSSVMATPDGLDASAKSGAALYTEQGEDNWSNWSMSGEWKTLHNVLLSDGTAASSYSSNATDTIWSPHRVGVADYAVEARIQISSPASNCYFGVVGRGLVDNSSSSSSGYKGYVAGISIYYSGTANADISYYPMSSSSASINKQPYDPGTGAHTYRVEFSGNHITMKIDNTTAMQVVDNVSLSGSLVGLESGYCQLAISNFTIIKL